MMKTKEPCDLSGGCDDNIKMIQLTWGHTRRMSDEFLAIQATPAMLVLYNFLLSIIWHHGCTGIRIYHIWFIFY